MNINKEYRKRIKHKLVWEISKVQNSHDNECFYQIQKKRELIPAPNWKTAPPWAQWFCVHRSGEFLYCDKQPIYGKNGKWILTGPKHISGWGDGEIVPQWRSCLFKRPQKYFGKIY